MTVVPVEIDIAHRRVLEALRAGVPSRDAVAALGSAQPEVEDRFLQLLEQVRSATGGGRPHPGGMLFGGGFGSGKSHVLEHLTHVAVEAGWVVSRVVISKETPLHDQAKVLRAAISATSVPDRRGSGIDEVVAALRPDTPGYAELFRWVHSPASGLDERFAATLFLHERLRRGDEEFADLITRFWAGDPIRVPELRRRLRELGEAATYPLPPIPEKALAAQRIRFLSRLMRAAGHAGWVLLFDEIELIGRYSLLQRAKSYAEIARWVRGDPDDPQAPLAAVLAMTDDFEAAVLSQKGDADIIPAKLRARQSPEHDLLAGQAEAGMRIIDREMTRLTPPDATELSTTYQRLKEFHAEAFGWDPPDVTGLERLGATGMRQYVRAWINEWDLVRLDPAFTPQTETVELPVGYTEDPDLDGLD